MSAALSGSSNHALPTVSLAADVRSTRRLLFVAGSTYLAWWFAVRAILPGSYNPIAGRLIVVGFFFFALLGSYARGIGSRVAEPTLTFGIGLLTAHYYYLVHRNGGEMPWAVGAYVVAVAAGACVRSRKALLGYSIFTMALALAVSMLNPILLGSIFLPGLLTMLVLANVTLHARAKLEVERAERVRAEARRASAEANVAARDEFIAVASHELYTPLAALQLTIQGVAKSLENGGHERTVLIKRLDKCERHIKRLTHLVDDLLAASRMGEEDTITLAIEEVDLAELVGEVVDLLSIDDGDKHGIVVEGATQAITRCDRLRMEQVVTNLIRNALTFGRKKPIHVRVADLGDRLTIAVKDEGIGIASEDQARIFDRFERAVSTKNYGGMGLGLYISKQIVEMHHGTLRVESKKGEGSTFTVDLPRA